MVHHRGIVISGVLGIEMADGSTLELTPGNVSELPPEHDGWVIGASRSSSSRCRRR